MKFYIHKLGCPKNDVDADYITARLISEGHQPVANPEQADSIIVNTCGFILPAKEESINELLRLGRFKKEGRLKTLFATGCLSQRYGNELIKEMPELDGAYGLGELDAIANAVTSSISNNKVIKIESRKLGYLDWGKRYIADKLPYAYLKISDGCNRYCSYCAIPSIRGNFRSRPLESIINEAEYLVQNGKKELILVSQEATLYGYNCQGVNKSNIITLLQELDKIEGLNWIRLMYLHPTQLDDEVIEYMTDNNKTLSYFDLPLQHINSKILDRMNRQVDRNKIEKILKSIREKSPKSIIRTTFIVGFPGETEKQFGELEEFVAAYEFDRLGVFTFSTEEGTLAENMPHQIPEAVKTERMDRLMTIQQEIAFKKNYSLIGKVSDVIIDNINEDELAVGRTFADCPDIDQEVYVNGKNLKVGGIYKVNIISSEGYDLKGTVIED